MKNTTMKRVLIAMLVLCMAVCMAVIAGCTDSTGNDDTNTTTYTVTVKLGDDENAPVEGVKVTVKKGNAKFDSKNTDAQSKVEFTLADGDYEIELSNLPAHYELPDSANKSLTKANPNLTVTLARKFAYKVQLVGADGTTPFYQSGVQVGICTLSGNCLAPVALGSDGVAEIEAEKGDYHVQILDLPAGYVYECDENGYYTGKNFSATETEMKIVVYPVTEVGGTAMTDTEIAGLTLKFIYGVSEGDEAYKFEGTLKKGEKKYYALNPELNASYNFYCAGIVSAYFDETFSAVPEETKIMPQYEILTKDKTYYLCIANDLSEESQEFTFVVKFPTSSYIKYGGINGTVELTVGAKDQNAIVEIPATAASAFKVTAQGEAAAVVESNVYAVTENSYADSEFSKGSKDTMSVLANRSAFFAVAVKADTYPATVTVKIERVATGEQVFTYAQVTETLTAQTKPEGKELTGVPQDGTAKFVYNQTDKYYHLGTADGDIVYVLITKPLSTDRFLQGAALAYMEMTNPRLATYYIEEPVAGAEYTLTKDYSRFLRGFVKYTETINGQETVLQIPQQTDTENYYAKYVNQDGAYPLTEELKIFLEKFYAANSNKFSSQISADAAVGCEWMFPLYYYTTAETEADVIVGEYKTTAMMGDEVLTVNADGTFAIATGMGSSGGTWVKNADGTYTFNEVIEGWDPIPYTVTRDAATGTLTFVDEGGVDAYEFALPQPDAIVGEYKTTAMMGDDVLTVNADGTFTIKNSMGGSSGTWVKNADGTYTFNEVIEGWDPIPYTVTRDAATGTLTFVDEGGVDAYEFAPDQE